MDLIDFFNETDRAKQGSTSRMHEIQGYNIVKADRDFYPIAELSKDVYVQAIGQTCKNAQPHRRMRKVSKVKQQQQQHQLDDEVPTKGVKETFAPEHAYVPVPTASIAVVSVTAWQDLYLYAISGVILILLLEQVFCLGSRRRNLI